MQIIQASQNPRYFGSGKWNSLGYIVSQEWTIGESNCRIYCKFGDSSGWIQTDYVPDMQRHVYDHNNDGKLLIDNVEITTLPTTAFTCETSMCIFTASRANDTYVDLGETAFARLYNFKVYDNGTLVRDMIPCTRNSDGVAGVYDIVNNQFYGSANGNPLVAGSAVTPSSSTTVGNVVYQKITNGSTPPPTPQHDYYKQYFTLATDDGTSGTFTLPNLHNMELSYSTDSGSTWTTTSDTGITITCSTVMIKGTNNGAWGNGDNDSYSIKANKNFHAEGNIMSLWYGDNFSGQTTLTINGACGSLFQGNTYLTSAENLKFPARTIGSYCYATVFKNCSNLSGSVTIECENTTTESLVITFENCSSLTKISFPNLTGITGSNCMYYTFNGCTALEELYMPSLVTFATYSHTYANLSSLRVFVNTANGTSFSYNGSISQNCTFYKNSNASWSGLPSSWTVVDYNA